MALALSIYSVAMRLATPLWLARLWWRGRAEPLYRHAMGERLGFGSVKAEPASAGPRLQTGHGPANGPGLEPGPVWIHAVSLGETHAAGPLIDELRRRCPGMRLLLTHSTATGRAAGAKLLREGDVQAWLPIDTPGATRRFLMSHRPRLGILMETEVWPNLIDQARRADVPMVLANARLSERSLAKGLRWKRLLSPAVAGLEMVLAQTEDDARRLRIMGARDVKVCGNLKFDVKPDPAKLALGRAWRAALNRPVVLAASTREGEEAMLLDAWVARKKGASTSHEQIATALPLDAIRADAPGSPPRLSTPLLVIVPRHPQRFDEVAREVADRDLVWLRRTRFVDLSTDDNALARVAFADVMLGDTLGEMALYYGVADVALLGGSFRPFGGQNLIEAAACSCTVVMGPSTFNFESAANSLLAAGWAYRAADVSEAVELACSIAVTGLEGGSPGLDLQSFPVDSPARLHVDQLEGVGCHGALRARVTLVD